MKFLNRITWSLSIACQAVNSATNCATAGKLLKQPQKTVDYKQGEVRRLADGRRHSESLAWLSGPQEQAQYIDHPLMAQELLKSIPRLESIAWMIAHQNRQLPVDWDAGDGEMWEMRLGAQILRTSPAFDLYLRKQRSSVEAALTLKRRFEDLDLQIIDALVELEPETAGDDASSVPISELTAGVILDAQVRTGTGLLVAAKGQEITAPLLLKLKTFAAKQHIPNEVVVNRRV